MPGRRDRRRRHPRRGLLHVARALPRHRRPQRTSRLRPPRRIRRRHPLLCAGRSRTIAAGEPLFRAAQRSGEVRDDVSLGQILDGLVALAGIDSDPDFPGALVRVLLDGLRPSPGPADAPPAGGGGGSVPAAATATGRPAL
ncbi:hypothetical protein [Kitasatospora sp. NPDC088134]|uniref:SbtR family transcriptional regulator n=1 Tax=Kitasatospora sp. NPDC088134 TaxID=3364071 RepID=UPI0037F771CB